MPGAFKLDHLQPFDPILFQLISNFLIFIQGGQFLLPQMANNWSEEFIQLQNSSANEEPWLTAAAPVTVQQTFRRFCTCSASAGNGRHFGAIKCESCHHPTETLDSFGLMYQAKPSPDMQDICLIKNSTYRYFSLSNPASTLTPSCARRDRESAKWTFQRWQSSPSAVANPPAETTTHLSTFALLDCLFSSLVGLVVKGCEDHCVSSPLLPLPNTSGPPLSRSLLLK